MYKYRPLLSSSIPQFQQNYNLVTDATGVFNSTETQDIPVAVNSTNNQVLDNIPLSTVQGFKEPATPWFCDQILPFDITIAAANEYGAAPRPSSTGSRSSTKASALPSMTPSSSSRPPSSPRPSLPAGLWHRAALRWNVGTALEDHFSEVSECEK